VESEREKYSKISESLIAADVQYKLKDKWSLCAEEACFALTVELSVS